MNSSRKKHREASAQRVEVVRRPSAAVLLLACLSFATSGCAVVGAAGAVAGAAVAVTATAVNVGATAAGAAVRAGGAVVETTIDAVSGKESNSSSSAQPSGGQPSNPPAR